MQGWWNRRRERKRELRELQEQAEGEAAWFKAELARELRREPEGSSTDDKAVGLYRAMIRIAERVLDEAVPDLKRAEVRSPEPLVLEDALPAFERRAVATARYGMVMQTLGATGGRLGLSDETRLRLREEFLEKRMYAAALRDAMAGDSSRPLNDRLLRAAQDRAVSLQRLARAAARGETLGVPENQAAMRANAAIRVARRLEASVLGRLSE